MKFYSSNLKTFSNAKIWIGLKNNSNLEEGV